MNDISTLARLSPHVQEVSLDFLDEISGGKTTISNTGGKTTVNKDGTVVVTGGTTTITVS
ncbi:MAG: hypothetical protein WA864_01845 [Acetobacteraceae bacterium]|jgi:hypothetical protein